MGVHELSAWYRVMSGSWSGSRGRLKELPPPDARFRQKLQEVTEGSNKYLGRKDKDKNFAQSVGQVLKMISEKN